MRTITYHDLQYQRERHLYESLNPVLHKFKITCGLAQKVEQMEREFFLLLGNALKIDTLPEINKLLTLLCNSLKVHLKVHLFLSQSPICHAASMPRYGTKSKLEGNEIIIMASQHFLNELDSNEQLSILGHELAHLLFGHIYIPARLILKMNTSLGGDQKLKSDILKWMICSEVSCDTIGYLGCGGDASAFSRAMLKYTTGLYSRTIQTGDLFQNLHDITFQQKCSTNQTLSTTLANIFQMKLSITTKNSSMILLIQRLKRFTQRLSLIKNLSKMKYFYSCVLLSHYQMAG
jgi:hypothetical protein